MIDKQEYNYVFVVIMRTLFRLRLNFCEAIFSYANILFC